MASEMHQVKKDNYECRDCGYIHTKEDGKPPAQCLNCGASQFREVGDDKKNPIDNRDSFIVDHLKNSSGRTILLYIVLAIIFIGSVIGTLILVLV